MLLARGCGGGGRPKKSRELILDWLRVAHPPPRVFTILTTCAPPLNSRAAALILSPDPNAVQDFTSAMKVSFERTSATGEGGEGSVSSVRIRFSPASSSDVICEGKSAASKLSDKRR